MSIEQHFKPYTDENGEEAFLCTPVGTILIVAAALYGDPSETTDKGKNNASLFISRFLGAARRGGFGEIDVLETLLAQNQCPVAPRLLTMLEHAASCAGPAALAKLFDDVRRH